MSALAGASAEDVLKVCSLATVLRADTSSTVISSLQVAANIFGWSNPADLLPLLLEPRRLSKRQQKLPSGHHAGRTPNAFLLQDAAVSASRANQLVDFMGFSKEEVHGLMRWSPKTGLKRDQMTQVSFAGTTAAKPHLRRPFWHDFVHLGLLSKTGSAVARSIFC